MSPQGLQAQAVATQLKNYDPKRDTKSGSLFKFLSKKATGFMQSGVLPENERQHFAPKFDSLITRR